MSIIITNISSDEQSSELDDYMLRINDNVICLFQHKREIDGLARCLRDAADAVDKERNKMDGDRWLESGGPFLNGLNDYQKINGATKSQKSKKG